VQISAEQILREAKERQEVAIKVPKQKIHDQDELMEYRGRKRKEFEGRIQHSRLHIGEWLKYATWEESQDELQRYNNSLIIPEEPIRVFSLSSRNTYFSTCVDGTNTVRIFPCCITLELVRSMSAHCRSTARTRPCTSNTSRWR